MEEVMIRRQTKDFEWRYARDRLCDLRGTGGKRSDVVVHLGITLLRDHAARLGSELWDVHEQVCVAAMDCGDMATAEICLSKLKRQFPDSVRVQRLDGMLLEASGKYSEALKLYEEVLGDQPTSVVLWKRKVAVFKARGDIDKAVAELNTLLTVFMSDQEAWTELADLYLEKNNYEKAAFCLEELLLANPHHHLHHQRYAEVCYSQKTVESLDEARKHFALAAKLNPNNIRALYGFYMACHTLSHHAKVKSRDTKKQNSDYCDWARAQIRQKYMQFDSEKLQVVERMLEKTQ